MDTQCRSAEVLYAQYLQYQASVGTLHCQKLHLPELYLLTLDPLRAQPFAEDALCQQLLRKVTYLRIQDLGCSFTAWHKLLSLGMTVCCVAKEESENGDSDDDDEYATASSGGEGDEKEEGADVSGHPSNTNGEPAHPVNLVTTRKGIDYCHHTHSTDMHCL